MDKIIQDLEAIAPLTRSYTTITANTQIVLEMLSQEPQLYADNDFNILLSKYRVHLFRKGNYVVLKNRIIKAIKGKALRLTVQAELYENDTHYHHIVIDFYIREVL